MVHTLGVIPARIGSTRFPRKVISPILSKPMIQHVWERCSNAKKLNACVVATDDQTVYEIAESFGAKCYLTPSHFESGTDRVAWVSEKFPSDFVVNIQGDEPLIDPASIDSLVAALEHNADSSMATLCIPVSSAAYGPNTNVVKVFFDTNGIATSFSRELPSSYRATLFFKHIGIYAFRRKALLKFCSLPMTTSEKTTRLEQLRALDHGMKIQVVETVHDTISVDTPSDIERVESYMKECS